MFNRLRHSSTPACFLKQRKHYRLKKKKDVIYPLTLGVYRAQVRKPWSERGRMAQRGAIKAFFPTADPWTLGFMGMFFALDPGSKGQACSEVISRPRVAVHPIGTVWEGAPG